MEKGFLVYWLNVGPERLKCVGVTNSTREAMHRNAQRYSHLVKQGVEETIDRYKEEGFRVVYCTKVTDVSYKFDGMDADTVVMFNEKTKAAKSLYVTYGWYETLEETAD